MSESPRDPCNSVWLPRSWSSEVGPRDVVAAAFREALREQGCIVEADDIAKVYPQRRLTPRPNRV